MVNISVVYPSEKRHPVKAKEARIMISAVEKAVAHDGNTEVLIHLTGRHFIEESSILMHQFFRRVGALDTCTEHVIIPKRQGGGGGCCRVLFVGSGGIDCGVSTMSSSTCGPLLEAFKDEEDSASDGAEGTDDVKVSEEPGEESDESDEVDYALSQDFMGL